MARDILRNNQKLHKRRSTVAVSIPKPEPKTKTVKEPNLARIIKFPQPKAAKYKGIEIPARKPIQWLAVMMKIKFGEFIPDTEIDRFCDAYLDLVINFYD